MFKIQTFNFHELSYDYPALIKLTILNDFKGNKRTKPENSQSESSQEEEPTNDDSQ